jgi:hypothetical protein
MPALPINVGPNHRANPAEARDAEQPFGRTRTRHPPHSRGSPAPQDHLQQNHKAASSISSIATTHTQRIVLDGDCPLKPVRPAPASPRNTAGRLLNRSTSGGNLQPAPLNTLAVARPRCTPQASTNKITKAIPTGNSHVHGYGSCRRDCCDITLPPTSKGRTSIPGGQ